MSENIGNLYVRAESEEEVVSPTNSSPRKSTSLSSLRNLRDTFKRSESRTSQTSLASTPKNDEVFDSGSESATAKACKLNFGAIINELLNKQVSDANVSAFNRTCLQKIR